MTVRDAQWRWRSAEYDAFATRGERYACFAARIRGDMRVDMFVLFIRRLASGEQSTRRSRLSS